MPACEVNGLFHLRSSGRCAVNPSPRRAGYFSSTLPSVFFNITTCPKKLRSRKSVHDKE